MLSAKLSCAIADSWKAQAGVTVLFSAFGEGLEFLNLWADWAKTPRRPKRLHVIGLLAHVQQAGLVRTRLTSVINTLHAGDLSARMELLLAQWPLDLPGLHRLDFEGGGVTLTLAVGATPVMLARLGARVDTFVVKEIESADFNRSEQLSDVLQTFAPLAVPDARVLRSDGQAINHVWHKGVDVHNPDWFQNVRASVQHALVIGGGFAGMGVAHSLALRGWRVTLADDSHNGHPTHQGHLAAALTPMVSRDDNIRARLSRAGSLRGQARWGHLPESILSRCGAIQLQRDQGRIVDLAAIVQSLQFPREWLESVSAARASELSGMHLTRGGMYFPTAARIHPQGLLDALGRTPGVEQLDARVFKLCHNGGQWQAVGMEGRVLASAPQVVVAAGMHTQSILSASGLLGESSKLRLMHALGGQISFVPAADIAGGPRCIVGGDGYVLPEQDGYCVIGSTYAHAAQRVEVTVDGTTSNLKKMSKLINIPEFLDKRYSHSLQGWAGWRAVLPGRLPAIGPLPQHSGLWVACGFASRGLTWAALAGDLIAGALNGEPLPLENDIIRVIGDI